MPSYKPKPAIYDNSMTPELGYLPTEFEVFEPNPKYGFEGRRPPSKDAWKIMVPKLAPPIGNVPLVIENLINSTWKFAEPVNGASRGDLSIGMRKHAHVGPNWAGVDTSTSVADKYHVQVRPTGSNISTTFPNKTAIASDWKVFEQIKRTNAVTFRGDTRPPINVITKCGGFHPPNSRTDQYYLENNIFQEFAAYMKRRYKCTLTQDEFLGAVNSSSRSVGDKRLLVDYMMWRKICEREAFHLGRMVENECLKGYISTARSIDTSVSFGTAFGKRSGWLYVTVVHAGFIVPWDKRNLWGSEEAEIAQWGSVPGERIVGFVHLGMYKDGHPFIGPEGPIFLRRSFRKNEPEAFEYIYNVMSGMTPEDAR